MDAIDAIRINFSPDQLFYLNICLGFLMFGVALDIKVADFRQLLASPRPPAVGMISQLVLLPLLTVLLIYVLEVHPSITLGMVLIAACPGGNVSNYAVHLAGGNAALSVLMTSISTLVSIFSTPLIFSFIAPLVVDPQLVAQEIFVEPIEMIATIFKLLLVPLAIGMSLHHFYPIFTNRIRSGIRMLSLLIFLGIVVVGLAGNLENIKNYLDDIFFIVLLHNTAAFLLGFGWAKLMRMNNPNTIAISIETGIQNSGLAMIIAFNFFSELGGMALVAAWWGIWHLIAALVVAYGWKNLHN